MADNGKKIPPSRATGTTPLFLQQAEELSHRLEGDASTAGVALGAEAQELARFFRSWATEKPTNEVRVAAIGKLLDLSRRVMEHVAKANRSSS